MKEASFISPREQAYRGEKMDLSSIIRGKKKLKNPSTDILDAIATYGVVRDVALDIAQCVERAQTDDEKIACVLKGLERLREIEGRE